MKARLAYFEDSIRTLMFPLTTDHTTIGRDEENSVQLPHPLVSKHHALITQDEPYWKIQDQNSRNGVTVNGQTITSAALHDGDVIGLGPVTLIFETHKDNDDTWTPNFVIDMSPDAVARTIGQL